MESVKLAVKIVPGASHSRIVGWLGNELKIRVSSPPEKGRANREVETILAKSVGIPKTQVSVIKGHTSAHKIVQFDEITQSSLARILHE